MADNVNQLYRRRFQALLVSIVLLLGIYPMLRSDFVGRMLFDAIFTLLFVTAYLAVFRRRASRLIALCLGIPTLIGAVSGYVWPSIPHVNLTVGLHLLAALFLTFCLVQVLRIAYSDDSVSAESVYAALCGYLFIGVVFGHVYCIFEALVPGSFGGSEGLAAQLQNEDRRRFLLTYFSFVTLTTAGYGDIVPASDPVRSMAMVETVIGQFYLAVLVAELIGKRVSQTISEQQSNTGK